MAEIGPVENVVPTASTDDTTSTGQPREQLEIEEGGNSEDISYPTGLKLWLTMASICIACFLNGLDLTVVAVAVPSLTDQFKTVADIGWYSAAYGMALSAFAFFFGKAYTVFSTKNLYICGLVLFESGSLLCTFAPSSKTFVVGRAITGLGTSAVWGGRSKMLRHLYPLRQQALVSGLVNTCQSIGLVAAPMIGGLLIDAFSWRACFGINLPLGVLCIALTAYGFHDPVVNENASLPLKEKLRRINILGTLLVVPAITCFLMALQWGGAKYGWNDPRIIVLFVLFGVLFSAFGYLQYRQGDDATVPLRILKQRSILGGMWFSACCNGILATTEYYIAIYFQGVRGYTAARAGLLGLPMIVGLSVSALAGAAGTTIVGYYFPFLFATSLLAPIASGILTTLDLNGSSVKAAALLGFLGVAVGLSIQTPQVAIQAVLSTKDISIGSAIVTFGAGMGSSLWVCASAQLFQNRLIKEIEIHSPSTNATALAHAGLSDIRKVVGSDRLQAVLAGYDQAVVQTLYVPLALGILTLVGSLAIERRSIKKKQT